MRVQSIAVFCDPSAGRYAFKATVYTSSKSLGFVGYGDADPSNVSPLVHGAEMRVAETRAVNRALRKAYGLGICSVEEIGGFNPSTEPAVAARKPAQPAASNGHPLRDRLYLLVRQHRLDAGLVKLYAAAFCGTEDVRQATREQMQQFVEHLASEAITDVSALRQKLERYQSTGEGAA